MKIQHILVRDIRQYTCTANLSDPIFFTPGPTESLQRLAESIFLPLLTGAKLAQPPNIPPQVSSQGARLA